MNDLGAIKEAPEVFVTELERVRFRPGSIRCKWEPGLHQWLITIEEWSVRWGQLLGVSFAVTPILLKRCNLPCAVWQAETAHKDWLEADAKGPEGGSYCEKPAWGE